MIRKLYDNSADIVAVIGAIYLIVGILSSNDTLVILGAINMLIKLLHLITDEIFGRINRRLDKRKHELELSIKHIQDTIAALQSFNRPRK